MKKKLSNKDWSSSRRSFVKGLVAAGISSQLGFFQACTDNVEKLNQLNTFIAPQESITLTAVAKTLFPADKDGPGIGEINAVPHIIWSLTDKLYGFNNYKMFKEALSKINDYAIGKYKCRFESLEESNKNKVITEVSKFEWGEDFLGKTLNYIFESLSIDPTYNVNTNSVGWNWLNHQPGYPRPTKDQLYPIFLNKFNHEV